MNMANRQPVFLAFVLFLAACSDDAPVAGPYPKAGFASWYSSKTTSTGEKFDAGAFTCAIRKKDFGKFYRVCNIKNSKCVIARHNDFGPSKYFYDKGRIVDLSKSAFSSIADPNEGVVMVTLQEK